MRMNIKMQAPDWTILIAVASCTLYIVFRNLGREIGSFAFLWAPLVLLTIFFTRPSTFNKGPNKILLLYGITIVGILQYTLWRYMNEWNQFRILYEFYYIVVATSILYYYLEQGKFVKLAWLGMWTFIFIIIALITTNVALYFEPRVVYQSAATEFFSQSQKSIYKITGAMSYSYSQAAICLIPILIYHIKNKKDMVFSPKILIVILTLLIITQIRTQVFANILVTAFITILSSVWSKNRRISFVIFSLIAILIIIIPSIVFSNMFYSLSTNFNPNSLINAKLTDFSAFIEHPDFDKSTEVGSRAERFPQLLEALEANPILGDSSYKSKYDIEAGAHLFWMNRLTLWGIPGFLFYVFMLYKLFGSISSIFDADFRFYYFLSVMALIVLGSIKAVGGSETWIMLIVVIPGLYFLPHLNQPIRRKAIQKTIGPPLPVKQKFAVIAGK